MEAHFPNRPDLVRLAGITTGYPDGFIPRCPTCKYDLSGLAESRCPECGTRFSIPALLAAWQSRKAAAITDADFFFAALLALIVWFPTDLRVPFVLVWKLPVLAGLWLITWLWFRRRRTEFEEPSEAHRLLWVWGPCVSTALGLAPTPILNIIAAAAMLLVALLATITAWRRSPRMTSFILALTLSLPSAAAACFGAALLLQGLTGSRLSHHWSFADYPRWYWEGIPGRARGISNPDAIAIGSVILAIGLVAVVVVLGMWAALVRGHFRARRARA